MRTVVRFRRRNHCTASSHGGTRMHAARVLHPTLLRASAAAHWLCWLRWQQGAGGGHRRQQTGQQILSARSLFAASREHGYATPRK